MGLIKKGSRQITVDGIVYRWRYPPKPNQNNEDAYPGVIVIVRQLDCENGSILALNFNRYHMSGAYSTSAPELRKAILSSEIALCIPKAIQVGWQSEISRKKFMLDVGEDWLNTFLHSLKTKGVLVPCAGLFYPPRKEKIHLTIEKHYT